MFSNKSDPSWSPLYFLAALGAGGMVATFFMYLLFWVASPGQAIPVYSDWTAAFINGSVLEQTFIAIAISGVLFFAVFHIILLRWNLIQFKLWKAAGSLEKITGSNAHTQMLAIPLTLGMTINVTLYSGCLICGLL